MGGPWAWVLMGFVGGFQVQAQLEFAEVHRTHAFEQQEAVFLLNALDRYDLRT